MRRIAGFACLVGLVGLAACGSKLRPGSDEDGVADAASKRDAKGFTLSEAGAVEAIFTLLALRDGVAPPTLNLEETDVQTAVDLVPREARRQKLRYAISNSFGFGGTNASLVLGPAP